MMANVEVIAYTCDACGRVQYARPSNHDDRVSIEGFEGGSVLETDESHGCSIDSWFACSTDCIKLAIQNRLKWSWCGCNTGCDHCSPDSFRHEPPIKTPTTRKKATT